MTLSTAGDFLVHHVGDCIHQIGATLMYSLTVKTSLAFISHNKDKFRIVSVLFLKGRMKYIDSFIHVRKRDDYQASLFFYIFKVTYEILYNLVKEVKEIIMRQCDWQRIH